MSVFSFLFRAGNAIDFEVNDLSPEKHDEYYKLGAGLIKPFMLLQNTKVKPPQKNDILKGIAYLDAVTAINQENWAAFWIKGKGYQVLGNSELSYVEFGKSYALQKENPDVARELMIECLNIGKTREAIDVALHALSLNPNNSGLNANVGLSYLIDGDIDQAITYTQKSREINPEDRINKNLLGIIQQVKSGYKKQPGKYTDLFD